MKKSACFLLVVLMGLGLLLPGCGGQNAGAGADGRTTITFWHSFVASTRPALRKLIDRFEEEHPDIRIEEQYIPTGDALVQKLITTVKSGTAPDVSWIRSHYIEDLVKADAIYEMEHFIDGENGLSDSTLQDIYPALRRYASWKDTLYSVPMEATNLGLVYNKDQFREVGLDPNDPPTNWSELRQYSRQLAQDENGDGRFERAGFAVPIVPATGPQGTYMMWQWLPFLWQAGGRLVNEEQTQVLFDEPAGVKALTLWKEMYNEQNQRGFTNDFLTAFVSGKASMFMDGPWNLPRYSELLPNTDWGVAMLPRGPEKRATVVAGEFLAVFKQTEHPQAAWTFLKWMLQPETQAFWSKESAYLPVRKSVLELDSYQQFLEKNPEQKAFVDQMKYAQAQRSIDHDIVEIQRLLAQAIEQATVGDAQPKEALSKAARKADKLLKSAAQNDETMAQSTE